MQERERMREEHLPLSNGTKMEKCLSQSGIVLISNLGSFLIGVTASASPVSDETEQKSKSREILPACTVEGNREYREASPEAACCHVKMRQQLQ